MVSAHDDLREAVRQMVEASRVLQAALAANVTILEECIARLDAGQEPAAIVRSIPVSEHRAIVQAADEALDEARTRFRIRLIAACMVGGMSRKELASNMGFSPQLVSRYIRAAERSD